MKYEKLMLVIPSMLVPLMIVLDLLPISIKDWIVSFIGGAHGMDTFAGRGADFNDKIQNYKKT